MTTHEIIYFNAVEDGKLLSPTPLVAMYSKTLGAWVDMDSGSIIEWIGLVANSWGCVFSSLDVKEVQEWVSLQG